MSGNDERFSIALRAVVDPDATGRNASATGELQVDGLSETFRVDLRYWSVDDYLASWRAALAVLDGGPVVTSCLVSSITDPATSNFFSCWPLYRVEEEVFVQNAIVFFDQLDTPLDLRAPWRSVLPRQVRDEDGNSISEWRTTMRAVRAAAAELDIDPDSSRG